MIKIIELFGGYRVVVHNEREDLLARVVESRLEDTVRYKKENTFKDSTQRHIDKICDEISHMSFAMFHLDMIEEVITTYELKKRLGLDGNV